MSHTHSHSQRQKQGDYLDWFRPVGPVSEIESGSLQTRPWEQGGRRESPERPLPDPLQDPVQPSFRIHSSKRPSSQYSSATCGNLGHAFLSCALLPKKASLHCLFLSMGQDFVAASAKPLPDSAAVPACLPPNALCCISVQFTSGQSLSRVRPFATP